MNTLLLLLAGFFATAAASNICQAREGRILNGFASPSKKYRMNIGSCKYHAIRNQECGAYRITLSPTNSLTCQGIHIVENMWLGVENIANGNEYLGRTSVTIARKYMVGLKPEPFNTKKNDTGMGFSELFNVSASTTHVEIMAKNGDFRIRFGLWDKVLKHSNSGFLFECYRDDALNPYPDQVCGNSTEKVIEKRKKELGMDKTVEVLLWDIFVNTDNTIYQPEGLCQDVENTLRNDCEGLQQEAIKYCNYIVGSSPHIKCLQYERLADPMSLFSQCVGMVCRNFTGNLAQRYCENIALGIDRCREFPLLSERVKEMCDPDLTYEE